MLSVGSCSLRSLLDRGRRGAYRLDWLGIPAGDRVVIRRSIGIGRAKTWRCDNSAFFGPLGGWKHELVAHAFLR